MADATNIDTLQEQLARQHEETVRTQALQQVLEAFAPGTLQSPVAYRVLLHRVRTLLDEALAGTPPPEARQAETPPPEAPPAEVPPPPNPPEGDTEEV
jgi:hypothetical protein